MVPSSVEYTIFLFLYPPKAGQCHLEVLCKHRERHLKINRRGKFDTGRMSIPRKAIMEDEMNGSLFWNAFAGSAQALAAVATFFAVFGAVCQGKREEQRCLQTRSENARPVLILASDSQDLPLEQGNEHSLDYHHQPPAIKVHNGGNGPVLNVRSVIYRSEARAGADSSTLLSG
jgi:hypothetical protein